MERTKSETQFHFLDQLHISLHSSQILMFLEEVNQEFPISQGLVIFRWIR